MSIDSFGGGLLDGLLVPDILLPSQIGLRRSAGDPSVHRLIVAVLEDALRLVVKGKVTSQWKGSVRRERLVDDAQAWIAATETHPFSFVWICEALGIDPNGLRKQISQGTTTTLQLNHAGRELGRFGPMQVLQRKRLTAEGTHGDKMQVTRR
jgi:hypothetical protein